MVAVCAPLYTIGDMPRKFIKRLLPDFHFIRTHRNLRFFGLRLHDPNLWHLNRRSASGATAIGLFWAFIPMPFQMLPAAACAIWLRVNLPISVVLVWITNPFTMPPIFFFNYKLGTWILDHPLKKLNIEVSDVTFELSLRWVMNEMGAIWQPLMLGSVIIATLSALVGYWGMRLFWRSHVVREWERRKKSRMPRRALQKHPPDHSSHDRG
jgi:uncharacterized protein